MTVRCLGERGPAARLCLAGAAFLLLAAVVAGTSSAGGQEAGPPALAFPFAPSQTWRITCGYALPVPTEPAKEATAQAEDVPPATLAQAPAKNRTASKKPVSEATGCGHSGESYNRFALDLQQADGGDAAKNQPILAAAAGTIARAGWHDGLGWHVILDHGTGYQTVYGHMVRLPRVRAGQAVEQGAILGRVGSTGRSTGPHIHFALWKDGVSVNPEPICGLRNLKPGMVVTGCTEPPEAIGPVTDSDFDGNGTDEVALLSELGSAGRIQLLNPVERSLRALGPKTYWPTAGESLDYMLETLSGDFDGDGRTDLATLVSAYCFTHIDAMTTGSLDLSTREVWWGSDSYCGRGVRHAVTGDFDGDALSDIALLSTVKMGRSRIEVLRSTGKGFEPPEVWWESSGYFAKRVVHLVSGNFGGDGRADLAALYDYGACETRIHSFVSDAGATFAYGGPQGSQRDESSCGAGVSQLVVGSFDSEGFDDDLAMLHRSSVDGYRVAVLHQKAGGFIAGPVWDTPNTVRFLSAGDYDGDGSSGLIAVSKGATDCSARIQLLTLKDKKFQARDVWSSDSYCLDRVRDVLP